MKRFLLLIAGLFVFFYAESVFAVNYPVATGFVNDFAGLFSQQDKAQIESLLVNFEKETSNEIVVAIVTSFEGLEPFDYSQGLFTSWGIGKKDKNNGILFLISPQERQAFINVGRGLEGAMPDSLTGSILRSEVFPEFKKNNYVQGVTNGIKSLIEATKGEYIPSEKAKDNSAWEEMLWPAFWVGFMLLSYLASFLGRTKSWWLGGAIGGVGGAILGVIFWTGITILFSAVGLGIFGLIFDFIVSKNYQQRLREGKPTDFWHSGGGFWFGGGGGGFGGGGGGFGGFGGGGSGGGGAGGSW